MNEEMMLGVKRGMALKDTKLFKPIRVGEVLLEHRLVMAPLTRLRAPNGILHEDWGTIYYDQRSKKPGSLIITEGVLPGPQFGGISNTPGLWTSAQRKPWSKVINKIHDNKSYVFVQLLSLGSQADPYVLAKDGLRYVSATDGIYMNEEFEENALKAGNPLHGLTINEIREYVDCFARASEDCIDMGADGVEILAANGYLLNQFLDPQFNKRDDEYGGSVENRSRFLLNVVDAIVERVGCQKVGVRISPFADCGLHSDIISQYKYLLSELESRAQNGRRLAYVHIVDPHQRNLNDFVYDFWSGIIIRAGGLATRPKEQLRLVESNDRTLVSFGRYFISNPDLVERIENGWPLAPYDPSTFSTGGATGYIDYPPWKEHKI